MTTSPEPQGESDQTPAGDSSVEPVAAQSASAEPQAASTEPSAASTEPSAASTEPHAASTEPTPPTRRDRLRPIEFIVISAIIAVFVGLVVLGSTREPIVALVFFGVGFIVSLVVIAMLALAVKPDDAEQLDLDEQNNESGASAH